ncbi:MAG: PilZ domain-containing protein [Chitinivibrionales bacterium]
MQDRVSDRIENLNFDEAGDRSFFDLSTTGVCCYHTKRLVKDSFVSVKINNLVLRARVVYCQDRQEGFRLGMQFGNVSSQQQKELNECVDKFSRGVPIACSIIDTGK